MGRDRTRIASRIGAGLLAVASASACRPPTATATGDAGADVDASLDARAPSSVTVTIAVNSTQFVTREHMLAAGEMQISGEPLATSMGRNLAGYSRGQLPPNLYNDPVRNTSWIDLPGFATAVESYEYSKQPMNFLAFESGAGTSLAYAPLVDPGQVFYGATATANLAGYIQTFATEANTLGRFVFPAGTFPIDNPSGDTNPNGSGVPADNPLGWPGIWPTTHVFASFDPTCDPTAALSLGCSITSDDDPLGSGSALTCPDFECDASSLHLRDRAQQIDATITPGADGFSGWKYGLWAMNYLQIMHDPAENPVTTVPPGELFDVGISGNQVVGAGGSAALPGTFIGSSDIEGFQAALLILEMDARADDWLLHLTTQDGVTLTGFSSLSAALAYNYASPLQWFPGQVAVAEVDDGTGVLVPSYTVASANSSALDLIGVLMGYSNFFALTDTSNPDVGGAQPAVAYFDGDPFPAADQRADGQPVLFDRALAMIRVAAIDLDRLHTDPATQLLVDDVTITGTTPVRGATVSTTTVGYAVIGLRIALRSISSQLELYSNNTPDTAILSTPLDPLPLAMPGSAGLTFSGRLEQMLRREADLLLDNLTDASGRAYDGWNVATGGPRDQADTLDAHTAAIRGLFAAWLATGDERYHDRAIAVYQRMTAVFYDPYARLFSTTAWPVDSVEYTPMRFALLESALRDMYELVATRPGGAALEPVLEDQLARSIKLVLDGWDDRNRDQRVDWPDECANYNGSGIPLGGLQMAERTLTGELGRGPSPGADGDLDGTSDESTAFVTFDRDNDCVPEVDDAHLPAALAESITLQVTRQW